LLNATGMKRLSLLVFATACAGSASGPGGVSFGGQQDIGEFRGILDNGGIPGPETLDANGFFNEHFNQPPAADCGQVLCITPGVAVGHDWLTGAHQATLQIAVNTPVDPATYTRLPMNLVVVVDTSGSMAEDGRLDKVKVGLDTLIDNLQDGDRLAIVNFDDNAVLDTGFGATLDRPALHDIVSQLQPGGSTNIFDGLQTGFKLVQEAPRDHQNRVILLSDGNATSGDTNTADIIAMSDSFIIRGVGLTTIGVGLDFDVDLMRGLAEHGAGNFYFLEDAGAATEVFTEELDYFVQPLALDIKLDAQAGLGWNFGEVVGSHLWASQPSFGAMAIPAAFVASRTGQTGRRGGGSMIFIALQPTGNNPDGKVADITMSFQLPGQTQRVSQTVTLSYPNDPQETPDTPYLSSPEMAERFAMYNTYLGFRFATEAYDYNCAAAALQSTRANAVAWNATHEDPDITADIALIDEYVGNLRENGASASSELTVTTCADASDPSHPNDGYHGNDYGHAPLACSAGGSPRGWLAIGVAVLVVARRRRR
jgi:Ca-activated chloride channel homolog